MLCVLSVKAEEHVGDSLGIEAAIKACIAMRDAAETGDTAALRQAAYELKNVRTAHFNSLRCKDDSIASLNGHLVFSADFADSLLVDSTDAYRHADDISRAAAHRGQTADGSILTRTCFVPAGKSSRWTFASKGHQELAVVAEHGGRVTMRIHVTNAAGLDRRYDDIKFVRKGLPQRKTVFELPTDRRNTVELEVVNCGEKDCTFVVISN